MIKKKNIRKARPKLSRRGYTLIELLIVLAMIVLLTVFALPSYNSFRANSEMRQKADEIKELIQEAYNLAQNLEPGVKGYAVIFDNDSASPNYNSVVLAKGTIASIPAGKSYPTITTSDIIKTVALGDKRSISCPNQLPSTIAWCGLMYCQSVTEQRQEYTCHMLSPTSITDYYTLEGNKIQWPYSGSTGLHFQINDLNTNKYFHWDGLDDRNLFEIRGLKTKFDDL